tara:strand:+ start:2845 stop:4659 length:1815 start_codon:yes stop_codon:yes gene_type:complete
MDNQINENAGPGMTTWTPVSDGSPQGYTTGYMSKIFAKFFATKAQEKIAAASDPRGVEGDLYVNHNASLDSMTQPLWSYTKGMPFMPEAELNRKRRYDEYEKMDDYPELVAALDIYADDSTQKDIRNKRWLVRSESVDAIKEIEKLFDRIRLERVYWDLVRGTCKFGDSFIEIVANAANMGDGIRKIKILNPYYILRIEDKFGYLKTFIQQIPNSNSNAGVQGMQNDNYVELDKNQIIHLRLHTSDPKYYPYGKSILAGAMRVYRSLKLMEDAMLVYRLSRAPERRIFYIDVGNLPSSKAEAFLETVKTRFKKEKFHNNNQVDGRYNPLSVDEDFFIPIRGNQGTKVETLKGAENLGEVDDVKYFRDKLLATLKIPKDYIVEYDKSPERKANLAQLDVKFARVIQRVQDSVAIGICEIAKKHLELIGYPKTIIRDLKVELPDPSDVFIKRKLEIDEAKARVVQAVVGTGLFPTSQIYKEFYNLTPTEIEIIKKELEEEQDAAAEKENQQMAAQAQAQGQGEAEQIETQGEVDMAQSQNQASMDMAVSDNQAKNDMAVNKPKPKPSQKKESIEDFSYLRKKFLIEEGESSEKYKIIDRIIKNKNK